MVQLWIDNRCANVPSGSSVLAAARTLGLDIPALCHRDGDKPHSSCLCCLVRIDDAGPLVPACSTVVREGMRVESESEAIRGMRRTALELLLADHAGDCHAPCQRTCPAKMDIPNMLRHVAEGDYRAAIAVVKQEIALPAILGRVCPEVCEHGCRRGQYDSPAAICRIKQFVADQDLASATPYQSEYRPWTGKKVAVVGSGPTGLTAVYHLTQLGHHCTLVEQADQPGGRLRDFPESQLPGEVLDQEVKSVLRGAGQILGLRLDEHLSLAELRRGFDAVLLAIGREQRPLSDGAIRKTASGIAVDSHTRMTSANGVFAAGNAVRPYKLVVQSVAEGKLAASCIDAWLRAVPPPDRAHAYESRLSRLTSAELCEFCRDYPQQERMAVLDEPSESMETRIQREAQRCLQCDCPALDHCKLHHYAGIYKCDANHFRGGGRHYESNIVADGVMLEPGKCILCGICVDITRQTADAAGLAFLGRSAAARIGPPPGSNLDQALGSAARLCAEACPTGAITLRQ